MGAAFDRALHSNALQIPVYFVPVFFADVT
jgi:hypothetical protein